MGFSLFDPQDWFSGYDEGAANTKAYNERMAQQQQADAAQAAANAKAAEEKARLQAIRDQAVGTARGSAQKYFSDRGLDPNAYGSDIESQLNDLLSTVNSNDPTPGLYLKNLGEQTFSNLQNAARDRATRSVDTSFSPDYTFQRIGDTLDDPILSNINASERSKADDYISNLLKRHVITDTGAAGAERNLDEQGNRVRSQLSDIGGDVLESGRSKLGDILGRARSTAGNIALGQDFSVAPYQSELDRTYGDFVGGLDQSIRSQLNGPLYDTSGLANIAGSASGAQNTKFDPLALAGQDEEDPLAETPGTKKRNRAVF